MPNILIEDNTSKDIIMDLNIPFIFYVYLFLIIVLIVIFKYFFSKEEIIDFIEKSQKNSLKAFSDEDDKLNLLTQLNTKINRDFLDNSKYYHKLGVSKIYGNENENTFTKNEKNKILNAAIENKNKIFIKKTKKVRFSNDIIYEKEN